MMSSVRALLVCAFISAACGRYGDLYPVSGSWFKDRANASDVARTLSEFQAIGGDTVLLRGAQFENRTSESIREDPLFMDCVEGTRHCVDVAADELGKRGLVIQAWITYSYEEDYSNEFVVCKDYDKKISSNQQVYHRVILWLEQFKTADDCTFTNGSRVAVMFTSYSGKGDPHANLLTQAKSRNITVYLGLPKPPYMSENQSSADLMNSFYQFNYRVIQDHKTRFSNNSAMKGYYSDVHVISDYIVNEQKVRRSDSGPLPPRYVVMFWRELYFLTGYFGFDLLGSPSLDLTHSSNTSLKGYMDGMKGLVFFSNLAQFIIRDGRGDGKAAYFRPDQKHKTIYDTDYSLWVVLHSKNSSITTKTTFSDVYYASIADFFRAYSEFGSGEWLMIEAYDDISGGSVCEPVDPHASGMDRRVRGVDKFRLDQALTHVGAMVQKVTAFAWDPLFECSSQGRASLAEQIKQDYQRPIISECRFHSAQNQSIVVIGFNIDGPLTQPFQVNYTLYDGTHKSISLNGYYFELDYGREHHLVESLVYIQLYDIPDLRDLKREGLIAVARTDGTGEPCLFNYTLSDLSRGSDVYG